MDFPLRWKRLWNVWDLRAFILISLWLQIVLIFSGSLRKRIASRWVSFVLWSAYLLADWVAVFALGILSNSQGDSASNPDDDLLAFWSPFLLLHLGGPDTITAFSLEDNELWMRHLLGLLFQVGVAVYVFVRSLPETRLTAPAILMFVAGVLKYGERTWALMCASMDCLRNSLVTPPDPGPNYAKFMEEYASKVAAGVPAEIEVEKEPLSRPPSLDQHATVEEEEEISSVAVLSKAHHFFGTFRRLVVDLILSFHDRNESQSFFLRRSPSQAFRVIEIELAFVYEALYTKSLVIHTACGPFLRCITLSSIVAALLLFLISTDKGVYRRIDVIITYTLLGGALVLESYAVCILVLSDWFFLQLKRLRLHRAANMVLRSMSVFRPPRRWSNSIAQHNLLSFCLEDQPSTAKKVMSFFAVKDAWDRFWHTGRRPASDDLKAFIFQELKNKAGSAEDSKGYKRFSACRGEWALQRKGYRKELGWSVEVEFDESILLWHIATDLCYYSDRPVRDAHPDGATPRRGMSKEISDYMLYLLVVRPFMLTAGIGQIRYGDTCAEAKYFFQRGEGVVPGEAEACEMLLQVETKVPPVQVKGDRSKSVLFDGCRLAKALMELKEKKWGVIGVVWVEMLGYAANHCRGFFHARQLSAGGELLTHVWFLMAHLGIGEQYRIEAGHARAKLIVEK